MKSWFKIVRVRRKWNRKLVQTFASLLKVVSALGLHMIARLRAN